MNPYSSSLLGGISAEEFLRDYWQKKPLLIRQAIPEFKSPLDPDELAGLALEEDDRIADRPRHGEARGNCAAARSRKTPSARCRARTGPCWCRPSTSSSAGSR
ncbi:MAG: cupin domain-containing protein [Pseudomonas sp.]